jgi:phosphoglycerol transferase MdoB-like AlkP superfamily enzyme
MLFIHRFLPVLILLTGLGTIGYALYGVAKGLPHDKTMKNLAISFRTSMDVTLLSGMVLVMTGFGFYPDLGVHVLLVLMGTVVSHVVPAVQRKRSQAERTLMPYAVATLIAMGLVVLGIISVARGMAEAGT